MSDNIIKKYNYNKWIIKKYNFLLSFDAIKLYNQTL